MMAFKHEKVEAVGMEDQTGLSKVTKLDRGPSVYYQ